jgi:glycosyltransferase involved in cell wall biosynthesis
VKPIRILFPFAGDTNLGGSHVSALTLAASLDRSRFDPHVLLHFQPGAVGAFAQSLGLDIEVLETPALLGSPGARMPTDIGLARYLTSSLPSLRRALSRIDPAIIHTNEGRMHANWAPAARTSGRQHVWHHRQDPTAKGVNLLAPLLSNHIVSVSEFSKPANPILPVDGKFTVIRSPFRFPDGRIDREQAHRALCAELGVPDTAVILGYFGAIIDRKRPLLFVEALDRIAKAMPERAVHGALFGEVSETEPELTFDRLRALAKAQGIADRLHLMGFRSPVGPFIAGVDATLVTAVNEPFGRTLIEAMHYGTPVIATRHGGNPEAIVDGVNGFLVEPETPAAFVAPVRQILDDPALRARITDEAQRQADTLYGHERHVEQVSRLYLDLIGRS